MGAFEPAVQVESAPPVVEEEVLQAPEEIVEVESASPAASVEAVAEDEVDAPKLADKDKVRDEFAEKERKKKEEEEKIVIKPAVLPTKKAEESSEEESSDEEEEEDAKKKKLSRGDLKPAVQIKVAIAEEEKPKRRPKKQESVEESFLDSKPAPQAEAPPPPAPVEEEESSEEEEEEEAKPQPKKLSKADLKPAVQIKVAIQEEEKPKRRPKRPDSVEESFLDAKPKVKDEFDEKDKKPKPEEEKIVITPKDLPKKVEEEEESSDEEEEEEEKPAPKKLSVADLKPAVQIKVAAPEEKKPMRRPKRQETVEESFLDSAPVEKAKVKDEFDEKDKKPKPEEEKIIITPAVLPEKAPEPPKVVEEPPKVEEEPDLGPK